MLLLFCVISTIILFCFGDYEVYDLFSDVA